MTTARLLLMSAMFGLATASHAYSAHHSVVTPLGEKVIHTRRMPVLLHKAVPPYAGKHVYQGRSR
jgi:hypothetical protein